MSGLFKDALFHCKRLLPGYWPGHAKYHSPCTKPRVVYMLAMPRTGSTLAKRYLGEHPGLFVAPNQTYRHAWRLSKKMGPEVIVIDKRTNNLNREKLARIYFDYGNQVWFAGIVRDPRDQLVSLLETDRHMRIPRTEAFWPAWKAQYELFLDFARDHAARGSRICLLRYEDLVEDPVGIKSGFLTWLGMEVKAEELTSIYSNVVPDIAKGKDLGEDWKTHQHREVHEGSLDRWRKVSDPAALRLLTHYENLPDVERFMKELGYGERVEAVTWSFEGVHQIGRRESANNR